jgi:hypothetical protein
LILILTVALSREIEPKSLPTVVYAVEDCFQGAVIRFRDLEPAGQKAAFWQAPVIVVP